MITQIKTGSREEWLELRKKYIGGSDASAVIGANPYRSAYALWAKKNGYRDGLTIDRIDPCGNYEPNNCRWLTRAENARRAAVAGRKNVQKSD